MTSYVYNDASCTQSHYVMNVTGMRGTACRLVYPLDNSLYITGNCTGKIFRPTTCFGVCGHFGCSFQPGMLSDILFVDYCSLKLVFVIYYFLKFGSLRSVILF
jgi:hypothetical protein